MSEKQHLERFTEEHIGKTVTIRQWDDMVREFGVVDNLPYFPKVSYTKKVISVSNDGLYFPEWLSVLCGQSVKLSLYSDNSKNVGIKTHLDLFLFIQPWMTEEYWIPTYPDENNHSQLNKFDDEYIGDHQVKPTKDLTVKNAKEAQKIIDNVNHPSHYTFGKIEVIEAIEDWQLGYHLGNVVKYVARSGKKDPSKTIEDLKKAKWYLERKIQMMENI